MRPGGTESKTSPVLRGIAILAAALIAAGTLSPALSAGNLTKAKVKKIVANQIKKANLLHGKGEVYTRTLTADQVGFLPTPVTIAEVPTMGVVELIGCFGAPNYSIRLRLLSDDASQPFFGVATVTGSEPPVGVGPAPVTDQTAGSFSGGGGEPQIASGGTQGTVGHWEYSLWRDSGDDVAGTHVSADGYNDPAAGGKCHVTSTVLLQD